MEKMKYWYSYIFFVSALVFTSCNKTETTEELLWGQWNFTHAIQEDGSIDTQSPYSLVEFTYSDGFILTENHEGSTIWFEQVNENFQWSFADSKLKMTVLYDNQESNTFVFEIDELTHETMIFKTPKKHTYLLTKSR